MRQIKLILAALIGAALCLLATPFTACADWADMGEYRLTAYCNCRKCCGRWAGGPTASGTTPEAGRTIAVDKRVIPLGTRVMIDGHEYVAEDTGSGIYGSRIDIFFDDHGDARDFGVQYADVKIWED